MTKIDEGIDILKSLGFPRAQQNERSALTLLALGDLKEGTPWSDARKRIIRIHDISWFLSLSVVFLLNANKVFCKNPVSLRRFIDGVVYGAIVGAIAGVKFAIKVFFP